MIDIDAVLSELMNRQGSDLHLKVGRPPLMRISGDLLPTEFEILDEAAMDEVLKKVLSEEGFERLQRDFECDMAYALDSRGRFRVNAFKRMGKYAAVLRYIPVELPTIDGLGLPPVIKDICQAPQGMVLVTGPTGSGKTTSLASMMNYMNETQPVHVVTVEDPVEFVYDDKMATINQRQLGTDVKSLEEALRRVLRQDPDVILMGEMRDAATMELAMHAAETGHLVFSTLHTNDAKQTVDRIIDTFPRETAHQIRAMLAMTLHAVLSQRLVKKADGSGRVAAVEVMINSPNIRDLIAEGKTKSIDGAIASSGDFYRMQTFNQALCKLALDKVITEEDALGASANPNDLKLMLKGIVTGSTATRTAAAAEEKKPKMKISRGF